MWITSGNILGFGIRGIMTGVSEVISQRANLGSLRWKPFPEDPGFTRKQPQVEGQISCRHIHNSVPGRLEAARTFANQCHVPAENTHQAGRSQRAVFGGQFSQRSPGGKLPIFQTDGLQAVTLKRRDNLSQASLACSATHSDRMVCTQTLGRRFAHN